MAKATTKTRSKATSKPRTEAVDVHQAVTDAILAAMAEGTPPWRKPWTGGAVAPKMPLRHNGAPYRGINVLMLWLRASIAGYNSPRWMTFKQGQALGGMVRKGEKAAHIVKFGVVKATDANGEERVVKTYTRTYAVFNAEQFDGLPHTFTELPEPPRDLGTTSDPTLDGVFDAIGAKRDISRDGRAVYNVLTDTISLPPIETFLDANGYYATLAHEHVHWTGAASRLDRLSRFQDKEAYAFEELIAEIGACLFCAELGLTPDFSQSAAYLESWLQALKDDKRKIFQAATEAQKAVDLLLDKAGWTQREDEEDTAAVEEAPEDVCA